MVNVVIMTKISGKTTSFFNIFSSHMSNFHMYALNESNTKLSCVAKVSYKPFLANSNWWFIIAIHIAYLHNIYKIYKIF